MSKIAVIQTAFPGDVILALPVFDVLKERIPGSELAAVIRPESVRILKNNPHIDRIIVYDKYGADRGLSGIRRIATQLKGFDKAIVIQRHIRSALIPFGAGVPERIGYENSTAKILYTESKPYRENAHEVQRCLDLIDFDNSGMKFKPRIYIDEESQHRAESLLDEGGIRFDFAVVAPGSVWPTKRYNQFQAVIDLIYDRFDLQVVMLGGARDRELTSSIALESAHLPLDLTGKTDLLLSAAVISQAKVVVANDSSPGHIAAAVGTPVVSIFGPTIPEYGFTPYSENSKVVDIGMLECRPCSRHGSEKCPRGHFKCMRELSPEKVVAAVGSLLNGGAYK